MITKVFVDGRYLIKTAILIAPILADLISTRTEVIQSSINNNQVYHEGVVSEQYFNLFEDNH